MGLLTVEQLAEFADVGYLVVPAVVPDDVLHAYERRGRPARRDVTAAGGPCRPALLLAPLCGRAGAVPRVPRDADRAVGAVAGAVGPVAGPVVGEERHDRRRSHRREPARREHARGLDVASAHEGGLDFARPMSATWTPASPAPGPSSTSRPRRASAVVCHSAAGRRLGLNRGHDPDPARRVPTTPRADPRPGNGEHLRARRGGGRPRPRLHGRPRQFLRRRGDGRPPERGDARDGRRRHPDLRGHLPAPASPSDARRPPGRRSRAARARAPDPRRRHRRRGPARVRGLRRRPAHARPSHGRVPPGVRARCSPASRRPSTASSSTWTTRSSSRRRARRCR